MSVDQERGLEAGTVIAGKYRVGGILGKGGMGMVYRAHHLALGEDVAIKLLRRDASRDDETVQRFTREAQSAAKLRSEHVARVKDVGVFDGLPFMVMEFLQGADLGQMVDTHGAMSVPVAVDLVLQACDAIAEAHSLGIVHRDLKPTNLFVSFRPDQSPLVKVLDFGISKSANGSDLSLTQTQSMLGTPAYMSPEQMRSARSVDARTDIWSIGTVLYELVEACRPFEAESFSEMCVKVAVDPPRPMQRAPELAGVVGRCLAKQPSERYADVAELADDLSAFAGDPDAARQLVTRAARILGRPVPNARASSPALQLANGRYTPIPGPTPTAVRDAASGAINLRAAHGGAARSDESDLAIATPLSVQTTLQDPPRPASSRTLIVSALAFIALGIGGALIYVKATDEPEPAETRSEPGERVVPMPTPGSPTAAAGAAALDAEASAAPADASSTETAAAATATATAQTELDAGVRDAAAGAAKPTQAANPTQTAKKPPIAKSPVAKPPGTTRPQTGSGEKPAGEKPATGEKPARKPGEKPFDPFSAPRPAKKG